MDTKGNKKNRNLVDSFNNAINGIITTIKSEKNMRIHIFSAIVVVILAFAFGVNKYELTVLILSVALVISMELINTGIEKAVDLIKEEKSELAKFSKDAAAGAVLVSAIASVFVGYIIFFDKMVNFLVTARHFITLANRMSHITVLLISLVALIVLVIKAYINKGTPLEGGMPSGHAAIAACITMIVIFITPDIRIILLTLLLYLIVCQSRIKANIHTISEVFFGSLLGFLISYIVLTLIGGII